MTDDHIVPRQIGGHDARVNIVPACFTCNQRKGNTDSPWCFCDFCTAAWTRFRLTGPRPSWREVHENA